MFQYCRPGHTILGTSFVLRVPKYGLSHGQYNTHQRFWEHDLNLQRHDYRCIQNPEEDSE